jgi:hypothetical protein
MWCRPPPKARRATAAANEMPATAGDTPVDPICTRGTSKKRLRRTATIIPATARTSCAADTEAKEPAPDHLRRLPSRGKAHPEARASAGAVLQLLFQPPSRNPSVMFHPFWLTTAQRVGISITEPMNGHIGHMTEVVCGEGAGRSEGMLPQHPSTDGCFSATHFRSEHRSCDRCCAYPAT